MMKEFCIGTVLTWLVLFMDSDPLGKYDKPNKDNTLISKIQLSICLLQQTIAISSPSFILDHLSFGRKDSTQYMLNC